MPFSPLLGSVCPISVDYPQCLSFPSTSLNTFLDRTWSIRVKTPAGGQLTHSPTFHFFRRCPNDGQHLRHYIYGYFRHGNSRWHLGIDFESMEEVFNPAEQVDENALAGIDIFGCLENASSI